MHKVELVCIRNIVASRTRAVIVFLYSAMVKQLLWLLCLVLALHDKKDIEVPGSVQTRAMKLVNGLENKTLEKQTREVGLFSLEQRRLEW